MGLIRATFRAMASVHEITLDADEGPHARRAIDAAIAEVARIEAKYSRYRADSVISRINAAAGGAAIAIDAETAALLAYADRCHALSGGRFDVTSGVLRRAWDFRREPPVLPDAAAIDAARARIGWARVEWSASEIRLPEPGMELDFGGIGKEYAADRVAAILVEAGLASALVNLGGDVRAAGPRRDGRAWRVGVRDPRPPAARPEAAIAFVELAGGAIATSGDYERFIEVDGRRYCHILDPTTGWPVDAWRSVSVVAPLCVVAGSCATIAMLMGEEAPAFLASQDVRWMGIDASGAVKGTLGVAGDRP